MSIDEVKRFSQAVQVNPKLQEEIKKIGPDLAALAAFAAQKGYSFSAEELQQCADLQKGELNEEQLDNVAGGGTWVHVEVVAVTVVAAG